MPTKSNDEGTSDLIPSKKKQKLGNENPDFSRFSHVLLECGVSSIAGDQDIRDKTGCSLEQSVTPSSLRASIQALLSEMHKGGIDVDNLLVLESMEDFISGTMTNTANGGNALLWKMLLPMNSSSKEQYDPDAITETPEPSQNLLEPPRTINFDASLIKILLRVDALQPTLLTSLLTKLQEIAMAQSEMDDILTADLDIYTCNEEIPRLIVSHIRWLELNVDPITLINASLECISVLSTNLPEDQDGNSKRLEGENVTRTVLLDLISTLPDIIDDFAAQDPELMESVISTLRDIRVQDPTMLIPCLDAVSSLRFTTEEQVEAIISDALDAVESVIESWLLPALSKFLVQNVPRRDNDLLGKVIDTFRRIRLGLDDEEFQGIDRGQIHDKTDSQALMLEALSQGFTYRMDLTCSLITAIKGTAPSQHGAADFWLLMCCAVAAHNKPKVNQLVKAKALSGGFNNVLLVDAIKGNGAALNHLFNASMLPLADALVRSNEKSARELGGKLYEEMFLEFVDRVQRQEIVGQIVIHIASGQSYEEIDVAMKVFSNIVTNSSDGAQNLRLYLPFLTSLLDNVQNFKPPHLRRLFVLMFIVGGGDEDVMNGGIDEVQIMINKFLAMQNSVKQIGIIGVVAYASCLSERGSPEKNKEVIQMLDLAHKSCLAHPRQQIQQWATRDTSYSFMSIFFDELCFAIRACSLPPCVKAWILDRFSGALENEYLGDLDNVDSYLDPASNSQKNAINIKDVDDKAMVDGNSINKRAPKAELRYNIDRDEAVVYLKVLSLFTSDDPRTREILPQQLCPLLRLLTVAYDERFGGDGIGNIDALLGCPILLPDAASSSIEFRHLSEEKKIATVSSLFSAVSWCREIINSFVYVAAFRPANSNDSQMTQEQECTRQKLVEKLKCLLDLEEEVFLCAKQCYSFAPPGMPPLSVPRDLLNETIDATINDGVRPFPEDEADDPGRMSAEEKKALNAIKKAAKKKAADKMKSKQKLLKAKAKYEGLLESRTRDALRPLSAYASFALGFPEIRVAGSNVSSSQELMLSLGASELKNVKVGDRITNSLLRLFNDSLKSLLNRADPTDLLEGLNENPYTMSGIGRQGSRRVDSNFEFLDLCIDGNVFLSIHERLVAAAEILGNCETDDDEDTLECTQLLLECVTTLLKTEEFHTLSGRPYFEAIIKQIADGDPICSKGLRSMKKHPIFIRSAASLFDLLEEAITGRETDDLVFTMVGVDCIDALVRRASKIQSGTSDDTVRAASKGQLQSMKTKLSKLCLGFLRREWRDGTALNKSNLGKLVSLYLEHSITEVPDATGRQFQVMEWGRLKAIHVLINEAMMELPTTPECKGPVKSFATCSRSTFGYYLTSVLAVLANETARLFQSPIAKSNDSAASCLAVVQNLTSMMVQIFDLTKNNATLAKSSHLLAQLKHGAKFMAVLKRVIPFCIKHFQAHEDAIIELLETTQKVTRQLNFILSHGKRVKDSNLVREGPKVRKLCEEYIHNVKGLLKKNGVIDALWGGTLKNKNIDGSTISETSDVEEDSTDGNNRSDESSGTESEED